MSCSDITAFVQEDPRPAEGGTIVVDVIGSSLREAIITTVTPWGLRDTFEKIEMYETLTWTKDNKKYTVTLTGTGHSTYRDEYWCRFNVCYVETIPVCPTPIITGITIN